MSISMFLDVSSASCRFTLVAFDYLTYTRHHALNHVITPRRKVPFGVRGMENQQTDGGIRPLQ